MKQIYHLEVIRLHPSLSSANDIIYYGPTYNVDNMSGNPYLNFFLFGIVELPANFLGLWLVDTVGRRWSQVGGFLVSAVCCAMASLLVGRYDKCSCVGNYW